MRETSIQNDLSFLRRQESIFSKRRWIPVFASMILRAPHLIFRIYAKGAYYLRSSNKKNRVMGILPMKHGQDGHATTLKFFLLETLRTMGGILILIVFYQDGDGKFNPNHPQAALEDATRRVFDIAKLFGR